MSIKPPNVMGQGCMAQRVTHSLPFFMCVGRGTCS